MKLKKLLKAIPARIRITKDIWYEIVFVKEFSDNKTVGECRYDTQQIVIKHGESDTETLKTVIHEFLHSLSFEYKNLNLTERQVKILEEAIFKVLKLNGILDWIARKL